MSTKDIDDEGRHCACDCGYEAAIKAAEDKPPNAGIKPPRETRSA